MDTLKDDELNAYLVDLLDVTQTLYVIEYVCVPPFLIIALSPFSLTTISIPQREIKHE